MIDVQFISCKQDLTVRLQTCAAILALTMFATPSRADTDRTSNAAVLAAVQEFSDARAHFDAARLGRVLTTDYVEVSPRGELDRRSAVLGFYAADKASAAPPMVSSTQDVRRYGDTAIVIGAIDYTVPSPNGEMVKRTVRVTYVLRRVGGRWLMASTQFTGVSPARPAQ